MNVFPESYKEFVTDVYVASFTNSKYIPFADFTGFYKNLNEVSLFSLDDLNLFLKDYKSIKIFGVSTDELNELKQRKIKFSKLKVKATVLKFDEEFFKLEGGKHEKIRRYKNYYTKKRILTVTDNFTSISEIIGFLKEWKQLRKKAHFTMFTGYDKNFFIKYYERFKDRLICRFFYFESRLIGFIILERVNRTLYNLIIRKANTTFPNLCLYIDYYGFKSIYEEIDGTFYVNMGSDIGESGMNSYKTQSFHVEQKIYNLIDVKIINEE